uniref:E3 ubiquitin-protein ligase RNF128 isoform X2 n=1 Tax=Geotrypetes seraphini TaxID=260995 RepID=A0A6P8QWL8_GEOSA|nr:E3 ubiquitin-protein ligase RNF128 isoform X2 [Geotrypetes seraphini]
MEGRRRLLPWLVLNVVVVVVLLRAAATDAVWLANLNITFVRGNRSDSREDELGVFGQDSPLEMAAGVLVPADLEGEGHFGCDPRTNFSVPRGFEDAWLALVQRGPRGGCTFTQKILNALWNGAGGVVIYNYAGDSQVIQMSHPGTGDIVAIMIGNTKGAEIVSQIKKGYQVSMVIEVGKKNAPWMNHYSIFFVSVSFFIVTAATIGYFIFYSARRLRITRAQNRRQNQLKADAKKAIGQLQLRTLKQGDMELGPDGDSCAVCIEVYKPNDVVRILTCNHFFHKTCIDPWLLEHRTCPMCKCDILKVLGVEVDIEDGTLSQTSVSTVPSSAFQHTEEDSRSGTPSSGYASVQEADERVANEQEEASAANTLPGRVPAI